MVNTTVRRVQLSVAMILVPVVTLIATVTTTHAQAVRELTQTVVPLSGVGENLCLPYDGRDPELGDDGEFFTYSGTLKITAFEVIDGAGATHRRLMYQYQGVSGTGRVSGLTYHLTGGARLMEFTSDDFAPLTQTQISTVQFTVRGPGNNQVLGGRLHITINANGERRSYFESYPVGCR